MNDLKYSTAVQAEAGQTLHLRPRREIKELLSPSLRYGSMRRFLLSCLIICGLATTASAQFLNSHQWKSRLVILFTPASDDPLFERQVSLLREKVEEFSDRDVVFIWITPNGDRENTGLFLKESLARQYYNYFSPQQNQFELILVGLDGTEKFRARNTITPPLILLNLIDKMPLRKREVLQGYGNKSRVGGGGNNP